jgi:hypothetical protein
MKNKNPQTAKICMYTCCMHTADSPLPSLFFSPYFGHKILGEQTLEQCVIF